MIKRKGGREERRKQERKEGLGTKTEILGSENMAEQWWRPEKAEDSAWLPTSGLNGEVNECQWHLQYKKWMNHGLREGGW